MICEAKVAVTTEQASYDAHGKRDPFVPLVTLTTKQAAGLLGVESIDEIVIEGIVYDPKHGSVVVVNGSILKEGEDLGNVKVIRIQPDGAVFSINGTEEFKTMYSEDTEKKD